MAYFEVDFEIRVLAILQHPLLGFRTKPTLLDRNIQPTFPLLSVRAQLRHLHIASSATESLPYPPMYHTRPRAFHSELKYQQ